MLYNGFMSKIVFCDNSGVLDIPTRLAIYKKVGIENIQPLWGIDCKQSENYRFDLFENATKFGLKIEIAHLDKERNNWMLKDGNEGDEYVKLVQKYIKELAQRHIKVAIFHPSYDRTPPPPSELSLKRMREIVKCCEENNVTIAIENLDSNSAFEMYLDKIKSKNLKVLFDIGHSNCFTHDTFELFEKHKNRIIATHLHNNWGKDWVDEHNDLNNGNIDFKRFFAIPNKKIEYYLIEATPRNIKTPEDFERFVRHNLEILQGFIS